MRFPAFCFGLLLLAVAPPQNPAIAQENIQQTPGRTAVTKVEPTYPPLARQYHLSGKVRIEVVVSPSGLVKESKVLGGSPLLANAALAAAKQWKYEAAPRESIETIDFVFH